MSSLLPLKSSTDAVTNRDADPKLVDVEDGDADEILTVVSSTTARRILAALYDKPRTPASLAETVDTSVQNVGYHLDRLQDAGLVAVVDTWYSEQGREMDVYAPEHGSLVLFAGASRTDPSMSSALKRLLGAVGVVGLASGLVHAVWRSRQPTGMRAQDATPGLLARFDAAFEQFLAGPGALAFSVGLGLSIGFFFLWYWRIYLPARRTGASW